MVNCVHKRIDKYIHIGDISDEAGDGKYTTSPTNGLAWGHDSSDWVERYQLKLKGTPHRYNKWHYESMGKY